MKIPPLKHGQAVQVDWSDAKSLLGWTYSPNTKRVTGKITSLGYMVQLNDECLTLSVCMDKKIGASVDDFSIPIGCIEAIRVLPEEWAAKVGE